MIVYGSEPIEVRLADFATGLKRRLLSTPMSLEEGRVQLALAGQLEQAVADAGLDCEKDCRRLTAAAAQRFVLMSLGRTPAPEHTWSMLGRLEALLRSKVSGSTVNVRTPEGFAWYGLYPDAYIQAADIWRRSISRGLRILVVGIRSIGTTLAATIEALLKFRGFVVSSLTVRPRGHPFRRTTVLPSPLPAADRVIIADEGPGLSGSSIASVAEALVGRGLSSQAITLFPGHLRRPGPKATAAARRCWAELDRKAVAWRDLTFELQPAHGVLRETARSLLHRDRRQSLRDVGGGRWRKHVSAHALHDVAPFLEQPKLLAACPSGGILLKFSGFVSDLYASGSGPQLRTTAEAQFCKLAELADHGFTVAPARIVHGWIAAPWLTGRRLTRSDANAFTIERIGTYIKLAACPALSARESAKAFQRLSRILVSNARDLLGPEAAACAQRATDELADEIIGLDLPSYGDGRLAPHEWIACDTGHIKVDAGGHQHDHTAVGPQSVWWDVAGASVEWNLDDDGAEHLMCAAGIRGGHVGSYFRAAYAAFRAGVATLAAQSAPKAKDQYLRSRRWYAHCLAKELELMNSLGSYRRDSACRDYVAPQVYAVAGTCKGRNLGEKLGQRTSPNAWLDR